MILSLPAMEFGVSVVDLLKNFTFNADPLKQLGDVSSLFGAAFLNLNFFIRNSVR